MMEIPNEHWPDRRNYEAYIQHWERQLRSAVTEEPDPAKRFDHWLTQMATGQSGMPGVRLIFIEQPYLGWAEKVEAAIEAAEMDLRKSIAYEIENPDRD